MARPPAITGTLVSSLQPYACKAEGTIGGLHTTLPSYRFAGGDNEGAGVEGTKLQVIGQVIKVEVR